MFPYSFIHEETLQTWTEDNYNKVPEDQYWNWKDETYQYSPTRSAINPGYVGGYACDNIAMALHCVYHSASFEEAVLRCINRLVLPRVWGVCFFFNVLS